MQKHQSNTGFFLVRIFPHLERIRRDTEYLSIFSPNAGKYGPEKTPYLDTFHAVSPIQDGKMGRRFLCIFLAVSVVVPVEVPVETSLIAQLFASTTKFHVSMISIQW